jgi:hypothetical protein
MRSVRLASKLWYKDGKRTTEKINKRLWARVEHTRTANWPRGHRASKTDLRHKASSIALRNTSKSVLDDKEEKSAKRDERIRRDKEEHMQSFADIQTKTLEVQERKLDLAEVKERARDKELELKAKECEATLLAEESKIMMTDLSALDPARRAWFESKKSMIRVRDAWICICCCYF